MSWHLASARSNAVQDASARSQSLRALSSVYAMEDVIEIADNSLKCPGQQFTSFYSKPFVLLCWYKQPEKVATAQTMTIYITS